MAIGETILGAVLQVVIDKLASKDVINFFRQSKFDQSLVEKLKTLIFATEKLLLDAEEKQMTDPAVKQWLEELRHWFYQAEDVADEIATEALRSSLEKEFPWEPQPLFTKVRNWTLAPITSSSFQKTVTLNIRKIVNMLESMLNQKDALGLRELSTGRPPQKVPTTSLLEGPEVHGRDGEKEKVLEILLSQENRISVVAIVGMGGIGKTTLAKMLYNDPRIQETFDPKAWVCVSDQFDIHKVTKSILESVTKEVVSGSPDLNFLQNKLSGELRKKKFLLVLDDVWNENYEHWWTLQAPFQAGANGSKIIITTRNKEVADTMCSEPVFCLDPLSDEHAWSLFSRHAFEGWNLESISSLEHLGKKIVRKCRGLPLAIKTLGSLLGCKHDSKDWEGILQNNLWKLANEKCNVIPALWLSYYHLPGCLKRCFSYCAIFPKDYKIESKQLVRLWMAENFVLPTERTMEEEGDKYLHQLVSRSFLEPLDESFVTMHDLMHDLAQDVLGNFLARDELGSTTGIYERIQHFSFVGTDYDVFARFQAIEKKEFLRTFLKLPRPRKII